MDTVLLFLWQSQRRRPRERRQRQTCSTGTAQGVSTGSHQEKGSRQAEAGEAKAHRP